MTIVTIAEATLGERHFAWDSVWSNRDGAADWATTGIGLRADAAIETAVILALFTDVRCPDEHPLAFMRDGDPRGYWGDGVDVRVDLHEAPLGSLLWLLERAPVSGIVGGQSPSVWAETFAREALQPLLDQGLAARIDVSAEARPTENRLDLYVDLYGRDGTKVYARRFEHLWRQEGLA